MNIGVIPSETSPLPQPFLLEKRLGASGQDVFLRPSSCRPYGLLRVVSVEDGTWWIGTHTLLWSSVSGQTEGFIKVGGHPGCWMLNERLEGYKYKI